MILLEPLKQGQNILFSEIFPGYLRLIKGMTRSSEEFKSCYFCSDLKKRH